jgi:hypothetical protein
MLATFRGLKDFLKGPLLALAACSGALTAPATVALAADSCNWNQQPNGTYFGVCVNDAGTTHCVSCPNKDSTNPACVPVSCNS